MIRVGIFFGGPSREREISFAGGRTVYDNLNKSLFEPVLIFVDSKKNFIRLDWQYVYKGTIRDFYPAVEFLPESPNNFQVYIESLAVLDDDQMNNIINKVGRRIAMEELPQIIDFAFLALHGAFGEDGAVQGLMESLDIPYSGSGILPSALGMNKAFQKKMLSKSGFPTPEFITVDKEEWFNSDPDTLFEKVKTIIGRHFVVRPANQGSSIGVSILDQPDEILFTEAVDHGFFIKRLTRATWTDLSVEQRVSLIRTMTDIREGVGLPVSINGEMIYHPEALLDYVNDYFSKNKEELIIQGLDSESEVVIEDFIEGKEFSCIVIRNADRNPLALPPTEIVKGKEVFDYRSKYLAGLSRKVTPIKLEDAKINAIRQACEELFSFFGFHVYARIDGFIQEDGTIYLNDPNTTSGMLPSSFFFHQAAEIGLNPSQFLSYIIRTSLEERAISGAFGNSTKKMLNQLDSELILLKTSEAKKTKVGVILGGFSSERHISVESGRNIFEKLASSEKYEPVPIFLTGSLEDHRLYQIPINILLKDNADDVKDKILSFEPHPVVEEIKALGKNITAKYASENIIFEPQRIDYDELAKMVDEVFIALHGRPGEDGAIQKELEQRDIPYNGSGVASSQTTINKFETNRVLRKHGFKLAEQTLVSKQDYLNDPAGVLDHLMEKHSFPLIAKPVDEGCSSAVKKILNKQALEAYFKLAFREGEELDRDLSKILDLRLKEEFPKFSQILIEDFIEKGTAKYFLEITGGMLTYFNNDGDLSYEVFEPSEVLAGGAVLSLEEKFLAGEGQNITPARLGANKEEYRIISEKVKSDLEKAARILNIEGYCRIDAFVKVYEDLEVETIIIEVNSLPGMTPATCIFHQAALNGYKPLDFIDKILDFGIKKHRVGSH